MRRKSKNLMILSGMLIFALCTALFVLHFDKEKLEEYKKSLSELKLEMSSNRRCVYVAAKDITRGSILDESVLELKEIYTELGEALFFTDNMFGYEALIDISAGEPVMANMVREYGIDAEEKEYEITTVLLMADQKESDYIDVRIRFPDGSDYLVLPHKKIYGLNMETSTFFTHCRESEILTMTSAIIDTYIVEGAKMYAVRYVNGMIQEAAIPNYPVRKETLEIILSDPNVVYKAAETLNIAVRRELEEKLAAYWKAEK